MIRTPRICIAVAAIAGTLAGIGCRKPEQGHVPPPPPPPTDGPIKPSKDKPPPVPPWTQPGRICNSPFAIVETDRATCDLTIEGNWRLHPRRQFPRRDVPGTKQSAGEPNAARRAAPGSSPFCVYEWIGKGRPTPDHFSKIKGTQECALAVGMGGENPEVDRPFYARNFDRQAKAFASEDPAKVFPPLDKPDGRAPIVAVLDASPHGVTKKDVSGHGYAVSRVIGHLSCAGGVNAPTCKDFVQPYVALPLVPKAGSKDEWEPGPDGGYIGYFHDLFDAFTQALDDWKGRRLIVNLSLGWDAAMTDPNGKEVHRMRELLERAACEGVLVIGAAGNGTTATQAPVLPAALESEGGPGAKWPLPDAKRCKAQLGITDAKPLAGGYRPLIHAVGSVDLYDERLPTVRAWAHPRLNAFGSVVTVPEPEGSKYKFGDPYSNTSISTAAVTGIVAATWRVNGRLDAGQVMDAVYKGGHLLEPKNKGSRTELCLDTRRDRCRSWPARRVTLCGALNAAGAKIPCVTPPHPDRDDPATAAKHFPPRPTDPVRPPELNAPCGVTNCGVPIGVPPAQTMAVVGPMGVATCGACLLLRNGGNGLLTGSMNFVGAPPEWFYTTVIIYDSNWTPHYYYPFGWAAPTGWFWQGLPAGSTNDAIAAEIDWTYYAGSFWMTDGASLLIAP